MSCEERGERANGRNGDAANGRNGDTVGTTNGRAKNSARIRNSIITAVRAPSFSLYLTRLS